MQKKYSLKDFAKELNISVPTVSRALKNHPDIGKELKLKVWALAKRYDYPIGESKKANKEVGTKTIGVIVPNVERNFYASIISGIEHYAKNKGYFIIMANSQESYEIEKGCVENLLKLKVEGLIVCLSKETDNYEHFNKVNKQDVPLVFFDRICRSEEYSSVIADNSNAAKTITNHLITSGAKNVAHITGPPLLSVTKERVEGYKKALLENDLPYDKNNIVFSDLSTNSAKAAINTLLDGEKIPDAVFCVNDTVAYVAMKEVKKRGYKIPDDIAITGFNDEFHSVFVEPELTTISHPTFEMGQETARLLLGQIASNCPHAPRQIIMKTKLKVRDSSVKVNH